MSLRSSYLLDNLALSVDSFDKGLMNRHLGKQVQSNSVQRALRDHENLFVIAVSSL